MLRPGLSRPATVEDGEPNTLPKAPSFDTSGIRTDRGRRAASFIVRADHVIRIVLALVLLSAPAAANIPPEIEKPMPCCPLSGWGPILTDADGAPATLTELDTLE